MNLEKFPQAVCKILHYNNNINNNNPICKVPECQKTSVALTNFYHMITHGHTHTAQKQSAFSQCQHKPERGPPAPQSAAIFPQISDDHF